MFTHIIAVWFIVYTWAACEELHWKFAWLPNVIITWKINFLGNLQKNLGEKANLIMSINIAISVALEYCKCSSRENIRFDCENRIYCILPTALLDAINSELCCVWRRIPFFSLTYHKHREAELIQLNACACFQFPGPFLYITFRDFKLYGTNLNVDRTWK